jgi:hypothetical protein
MLYIILADRWRNIVLSIQAPTEDKIQFVKDSFYKDPERVFNNFLKCHMNILLADFNAKVDREDIFNPKVAKES